MISSQISRVNSADLYQRIIANIERQIDTQGGF
jgi:hypothetical protein